MISEQAFEIRKKILTQRNSLTQEQVDELSSKIIEKFSKIAPRSYFKGLPVGIYKSIGNELDLTALAGFLRQSGALIHYPRIKDASLCTLDFVEMQLESSWKTGPYGIEEPDPGLPACNPKDLKLLFVPGLAFGTHGERLGWGAGYYDRFTARLPSLLKVVLTFDFQLVDSLPQNTWDQPVDWIMTEAREIRVKNLEKWMSS